MWPGENSSHMGNLELSSSYSTVLLELGKFTFLFVVPLYNNLRGRTTFYIDMIIMGLEGDEMMSFFPYYFFLGPFLQE